MVTIDLSSHDEGGRSLVRRARARTLSTRRLKRERSRVDLLVVIDDDDRPRTRAECRGGCRPCLYVSCRFHLYLDVNEATGSIKLNHPGLEPWEMKETCALDIAERGGLTHEEIGRLLNVTRERARQVEEAGLNKLKHEM